jgi:hypothetical protein
MLQSWRKYSKIVLLWVSFIEKPYFYIIKKTRFKKRKHTLKGNKVHCMREVQNRSFKFVFEYFKKI